jgi:hypothetical protein
MDNILSYQLFEASKPVAGLPTFIQTLDANYPDKEGIFEEIAEFITDSGCPSIKFDNLYGAMGISKTDECIIGKSNLGKPIGDILYVILHEIAHQYQYKKYGKDLMWDAYNSNIDIDKAADLLMNIEQVADKLASLKANSLLKEYEIKTERPISTFYSAMGKDYFKRHLVGLRNEVANKNFNSVEDVNEYMYNKLKIKPKPIVYSNIQRKPTVFRNQSVIDEILDKLSDTGWSSLTEIEKSTLRKAGSKK